MESEKQIEKSALLYLDYLRKELNDELFFWKQNTVGVFDQTLGAYRRPKSKFIISGVSDIIAIYKGMIICIEIKTSRNKQTANQVLFQKNVEKAGGLYYVIREVHHLQRVFESIRRNFQSKDRGSNTDHQ